MKLKLRLTPRGTRATILVSCQRVVLYLIISLDIISDLNCSQIPDSSRGMKNIKDLLDSHILTLKSGEEGEDPTSMEISAHEHKFKGLWAHK